MRNEGRGVAAVLGTLPFGWATANIGDIIGCEGLFADGDWVESKDQDPKGDVRLTQLADVGDGIYRNKSNRFLKYEKAVQLGCTFLQPNDLMVARMPDPLGRACIFPGDSKPSVTAVDVCIVRTGVNGADHQWLMHTINSPKFRSAIASLQSGSTRKRISRSNLAKIEFPLPPLPEQHRIVAKIEELFTKLDAGVETLNKTKAQLGRYRQAVLKHAFEGKLTKEWREYHKDEMGPASMLLERIKEEHKKNAKGEFREIPILGVVALPELPRGWAYATLDYLVGSDRNSIKRGPFGSTIKKAFFVPHGYKVYEQGNVIYNDFKRGSYFIDGRKFRELKDFEVKAGDVLMSCSGTVGKIAIVPERIQPGVINQALLKITLNNKVIDTLYFTYLLRSRIDEIVLKNTRGSAMVNISSVSDLRRIPFAIPPLAEQHKIVEEIECCFSVADQVEKIVEQSLKQAEGLRQSILKRAFEGKLVPQDPNDEPAEKLLERIKAEKANREADEKAAGKGRKRLNTIQGRLM